MNSSERGILMARGFGALLRWRLPLVADELLARFGRGPLPDVPDPWFAPFRLPFRLLLLEFPSCLELPLFLLLLSPA
jgi:hypothetical protein